jgi:hypothetical protein
MMFLFMSNEMIIENNHISIITLPVDPNLIPENLESKLKLYLTFQ